MNKLLPDASDEMMMKQERSGSFGAYKNYQNLVQGNNDEVDGGYNQRIAHKTDATKPDFDLDYTMRMTSIPLTSAPPDLAKKISGEVSDAYVPPHKQLGLSRTMSRGL